MASRAPEPDIDHLYQIPPGEFIAARNELAKRAGAASAEVRGLQKPTLPAWAINQLYWQKRPVYDDLIARAADLRATHEAALRGRKADLRGAARAHEEAVDRALKTTLALLADTGNPVTDATRQAVATTLRELPSREPAGRLSRQLEPRGFDVFAAGLPTAGRVKVAPPPTKAAKSAAAKPSREDTARAAAAKAAVDAATRAVREAEQAVRRDEFEAARTGRDAEKAARQVAELERRLEAAKQAVEEAEDELKTAQRAAAAAAKARDAAQARVDKSSDVLAAARDKEEAARKKLAG
jgi:hypothetical protein